MHFLVDYTPHYIKKAQQISVRLLLENFTMIFQFDRAACFMINYPISFYLTLPRGSTGSCASILHCVTNLSGRWEYERATGSTSANEFCGMAGIPSPSVNPYWNFYFGWSVVANKGVQYFFYQYFSSQAYWTWGKKVFLKNRRSRYQYGIRIWDFPEIPIFFQVQ